MQLKKKSLLKLHENSPRGSDNDDKLYLSDNFLKIFKTTYTLYKQITNHEDSCYHRRYIVILRREIQIQKAKMTLIMIIILMVIIIFLNNSLE